ncbi:hypothetical protein [Rhizobium sp. CC-YZS058]|uniref:hypothetical protein n=1 Tax=Rhizobium sp. CC-YZS058 TaxID=3042153 RepID=UPI002B054FFB|nr:hypothetical protein [Rhizobium sp. CC-YZS058]MEA3534282.1 hypothetical protein [Rhizobium sp. CC-YZS058]
MFERAIVRHLSGLSAFDFGLFAETLLFYKETLLLINAPTSFLLLKHIGIDGLKRMVEDGHCRLSYQSKELGVVTDSHNGLPIYAVVEATRTFQDTVREGTLSQERLIADALVRAGFGSVEASKAVRQLLDIAPNENRRFSGRDLPVLQMAMQDLLNRPYTQIAAKISIESRFPMFRVPDHWTFVIHETAGPRGDRLFFVVETNYDFDYLRKLCPWCGEISTATVLNDILETRGDLVFSAKQMAEPVTSPLRSRMMQVKFDLLSKIREKSHDDIRLFNHVMLKTNNIRGAVNSGKKNFSDVIEIIENAGKFKGWLTGVDPEVGLLTEYYKAITKTSWIERLPTKCSRFTAMTGAGVLLDVFATGGVATAVGLGLAVADTFLIDRLFASWRPNHFVENDLVRFVQ